MIIIILKTTTKVACMGDIRNTILIGKLRRNEPLRRPRHR
jgi:hypothetical protein